MLVRYNLLLCDVRSNQSLNLYRHKIIIALSILTIILSLYAIYKRTYKKAPRLCGGVNWIIWLALAMDIGSFIYSNNSSRNIIITKLIDRASHLYFLQLCSCITHLLKSKTITYHWAYDNFSEYYYIFGRFYTSVNSVDNLLLGQAPSNWQFIYHLEQLQQHYSGVRSLDLFCQYKQTQKYAQVSYLNTCINMLKFVFYLLKRDLLVGIQSGLVFNCDLLYHHYRDCKDIDK